MSTAIVFSYGDMGTAAFTALGDAGAQVLALVLPSNRVDHDVGIARAAALQAGLPIRMQPPRDRIEPFVEELGALAPDVIVIWSYSMILPEAVIGVPRRGCVNVHGGLLPAYRGPHVMQWAIINGESETGVTLHYVDDTLSTELARMRSLLADGGTFVMIDIVLPAGPDPSFLRRQFRKLERGAFVRQPDQYRAIVERHFRVRRVDWDRSHVVSLPRNPVYNDLVILECGT